MSMCESGRECSNYKSQLEEAKQALAVVRDQLAKAQAALKEAEAWTDDDQPIPENAAILDAHPSRAGRAHLFADAMRMVGAKRSKGALVGLVNWLLYRATMAEEERDRAQAEIERLHRIHGISP